MRFEKQTYTQTPNSLFLEMKNMDECELKVVLLICRYTFGYHRDEVKLSTRRIADEIGMNTASVQKGADKAIERGLIEKVIDGNKTTTWRALVSDSEIESPAIQFLNHGVSNNESQSRVKEIKENNKETTADFGSICKVYTDNIALITPMVAEELKDIADVYPAGWFEDAVKEAVKNNVRKLNYVTKILVSWQTNGRTGVKKSNDKSSMFETLK